ncbi:MAG: hypothetical protein JSV80_07360, partial [Acidobacteriota bacterium]
MSISILPNGRTSARPRHVLLNLLVELLLAGGIGGGIGMLVGVLASVLESNHVELRLVVFGGLSGLLAALLAVITGRELLPRLVAFSLPFRATLMVLTLVGGACAATALGFWMYPWFSLYAFRSVALVAAINGLLALVAGSLVFTYEDLARRLARARELLAAERLAQAEESERAARPRLQAKPARKNPQFIKKALKTGAARVTRARGRAHSR